MYNLLLHLQDMLLFLLCRDMDHRNKDSCLYCVLSCCLYFLSSAAVLDRALLQDVFVLAISSVVCNRCNRCNRCNLSSLTVKFGDCLLVVWRRDLMRIHKLGWLSSTSSPGPSPRSKWRAEKPLAKGCA